MGNKRINGKEYGQKQIVDLLWHYMVNGQTAASVCNNVLGMSKQEIGSTRQAWRHLEGVYKSFGFMKTYKNGSYTPYNKICYNKLEQYVYEYWTKNATEKDLIEYFPEIEDELQEAKKRDSEKEYYSTGNTRGPYTENDASYQYKNRRVSQEYQEDEYDEMISEEDNLFDGFKNGMGNAFKSAMNGSKNGNGISTKTILIIVAVIVVFIFRKQLFSLIITVLPYAVVLVIIFLLFKSVSKGGSGRRSLSGFKMPGKLPKIHLGIGNIVGAGFFWILAISGLKNGAANNIGSLILAIIFFIVGFLCLTTKR